MSTIYCELSKQLQLFSFPANRSIEQLLAAGTTTINHCISLMAKKGKPLLMVFLPKY